MDTDWNLYSEQEDIDEWYTSFSGAMDALRIYLDDGDFPIGTEFSLHEYPYVNGKTDTDNCLRTFRFRITEPRG